MSRSGRGLVCLLALQAMLCSWWHIPHASAQSEPPELATYVGWVREGFAAAQRNDLLGLEEVADRLTATTSVRLPDNQRIEVDNRWLRDALESQDPDLDAIAKRLGAIIDVLAQPASGAPADSLDRLREILESPPFKTEEDSRGWLEAFFDWLGRLLDQLFRPASSNPPSAETTEAIFWALGGIGVLLLLVVIVYIVLGLRRGMAATARLVEDDPEAHLTARTAMDQASDLARSGEYRIAVRYLYLSALLWLDERNLLRYDRALTNREYLQHVRENPALHAQLSAVVETFDRVWYGHLPLDDQAFEAYRAQVDSLRRSGEK